MKYQPLLGFAPDADPTTPGTLRDCNYMLPSLHGLTTMPKLQPIDGTFISGSASAWPANTVTIAKTFGTNTGLGEAQIIAATDRGLFQLRGTTSPQGSWVNISRLSGGNYLDTLAAGHSWTLDRFGDYIIASKGNAYQRTRNLTMQAYAGGVNFFADVAGAPQAVGTFTVAGFVMAFNIYGGSDGYDDAWKCSARDDHTDWTLSVSTLCTTGRLVDTDGPIMAGIAFGDDALLFKAQSVYRGRFVTSEEVWAWELLSNAAGCINSQLVARDKRGIVYFVGVDNLYAFDGAQVVGVMEGVIREWFVNAVDQTLIKGGASAGKFNIVIDTYRDTLFFTLKSAKDIGTGTPEGDTLFAFNLLTRQWTRTHNSNIAWFDCIFSLNIDQNTADTTPYGYHPSDTVLGMFDTSHHAYRLGDEAVNGYWPVAPFIVTHDFGDDGADIELQSLRLRYKVAPAASNALGYHRRNLDGSLIANASGAVNRTTDGKYEVRQTDNWHRIKYEFGGHAEVLGYAIDADPVGMR